MLQAYNYTLKYKSGKSSRLPLANAPKNTPVPEDIVHLMITSTLVTRKWKNHGFAQIFQEFLSAQWSDLIESFQNCYTCVKDDFK